MTSVRARVLFLMAFAAVVFVAWRLGHQASVPPLHFPSHSGCGVYFDRVGGCR